MKREFCLFWVAMAMAAGPKIQVHGHRGARAVRPENTIPAFEYAIQAGADVVELDLAVTRDNVLVVSHDPELKGPLCTGPRPSAVIRELTLAEVKQWECGREPNPAFPRQVAVPGTRVPTLDEVFALAPRGKFGFNVETKLPPGHPERTPPPEEFARLVVEAIRRHGLEARVIVQSFDFRVLQAMKRLAPGVRRAALYSGKPRDFVELAREAGAGIVSPQFELVTQRRVEAAHRAGLQVIPYTANTVEQWDTLMAAGVDGIITDDPAGLIEHLRSSTVQ